MESNRILLRADFPRPSVEAMAPFVGASSGNLCDAAGGTGALAQAIRPVTAKCRFFGIALPVRLPPGDHLALWAALEVARPGDVLMVATGGFTGCAVMGDLMGGLARNAGVAAVITDGALRDADGLAEIGVVAFAAALSPQRPTRDGPGEVGGSVTIGGVSVAAGDLVIGDRDGVVAVPQSRLPEIATALKELQARETQIETLIAAGARGTPAMRERLRQAGLDFKEP